MLLWAAGVSFGGWLIAKRAQQKKEIQEYLNMKTGRRTDGRNNSKRERGTGIENVLIRAGIAGKEAQLIAVIVMAFAAGWVFGYVLTGTRFLANFSVLIGPFIVWQYLEYRISRNDLRLYHQCGELAKLMSNATKAGMTPERALGLIAERLDEPLKYFMLDAAGRVAKGEGLVEALEKQVPMIRNTPYNLFVRATANCKKKGGDISESYAGIYTIVVKSSNAMEKVRVTHAAGKRRGLILTAVPVGVLFLMRAFVPDYVRPLFTTSLGYMALGVVALLILSAWVLISRITALKGVEF